MADERGGGTQASSVSVEMHCFPLRFHGDGRRGPWKCSTPTLDESDLNLVYATNPISVRPIDVVSRTDAPTTLFRPPRPIVRLDPLHRSFSRRSWFLSSCSWPPLPCGWQSQTTIALTLLHKVPRRFYLFVDRRSLPVT